MLSEVGRNGLLYRTGRWCARHWLLVLVAWLVLLAGVSLGHRALGGAYSDDFSLPGTPAQQGASLLQAHLPAAGGQTGQLVFTGALASNKNAIEAAVGNVEHLPHVLSATDPLAAATTAPDGRTAYSTVHFSANPQSLGAAYVGTVDRAVAPARAAGVSVSYGGQLGAAAVPKGGDARSELIGIAAALLVLLIGFGSVYAAGLPIVTALAGAAVGVGVLGLLAAATTFATVSPTLAIMIGLGVGIDYALFLTTRHRQLVIDGAEPADAAGRAWPPAARPC